MNVFGGQTPDIPEIKERRDKTVERISKVIEEEFGGKDPKFLMLIAKNGEDLKTSTGAIVGNGSADFAVTAWANIFLYAEPVIQGAMLIGLKLLLDHLNNEGDGHAR